MQRHAEVPAKRHKDVSSTCAGTIENIGKPHGPLARQGHRRARDSVCARFGEPGAEQRAAHVLRGRGVEDGLVVNGADRGPSRHVFVSTDGSSGNNYKGYARS
jgi:hypothetical protein